MTWSLSNPSIATLSNQSNTGTNVTFNGNDAQTLIATINNSCGQTITKSFLINSGSNTFVSNATISGASTICTSTAIYQISGLLTGQSISWSSSKTSIATINNSTANSVTINNLATGNFNLIATITNSCGQTAIITYPIITYLISSLPIPSGSFDVDFLDCFHDAALPINYYPNVPFGGIITITPSILAHPLQSQTKNITVKYTNPCTGAFTTKVIRFNYLAPDCRSSKMSSENSIFKIYPNPASDIVHIDLENHNSKTAENSKISAELFDIMGILKSKINIINNKASFSVNGYNKGVYILKIYMNDKIENHQIIVK